MVTTRFALALSLLLSHCGFLPSAAAADDVRLFLLERSGRGVTIEPLTIAEGRTQVIICGPDSSIIDIICPPAPGGSGSLAQTSRQRMLIARNVAGKLKVTERISDRDRELAVLEDPEQYEIRVCVTAADGIQQAFLITRNREVSVDTIGPVIDMFAGKIPLQTGDYVVCTDTVRLYNGPAAAGEPPMEYARYLFVRGRIGDGKEGDFVLDLGAGQTTVSKTFLPADTPISEAHMVQYSSAGKELLKYEPGGATGKVQTVLGTADLASLRFGGINFSDVSVSVLSELPDFFGRPVAGILGIDLLRRAECVTLVYPKEGQTAGCLRLSAAAEATSGGGVSLPIVVVNTHLMVKADANDKPVSFIVDTGAPKMFLDQQTAESLNIKAEGEGRDAHGLDQGRSHAWPGRLERLELGSRSLRPRCRFWCVAGLRDHASHGQRVGLLGNAELAEFGKARVDFRSRRLVLGD